jgi:hypothetical protein
MSRFHFPAIATMLIMALIAPAQQILAERGSTEKQQPKQEGVPKAETQLKFLTDKLDLTGDQQTKIKPILQQLHDATVMIVQDSSVPREARVEHVRPLREKADQEMRKILSNNQKSKLDQLYREPHPELHGNISGVTSTPE